MSTVDTKSTKCCQPKFTSYCRQTLSSTVLVEVCALINGCTQGSTAEFTINILHSDLLLQSKAALAILIFTMELGITIASTKSPTNHDQQQ